MAQISWKPQTEIDAEKLTNARDAKINELKNACSQAIFNGFVSESTGYEFGFNELDQSNFTQQMLLIVAAGGPDKYSEGIKWKTKSNSVVDLAANQFLAIIEEAKNHKLIQQGKYWQLEYKVLNANTVEAIEAIVW